MDCHTNKNDVIAEWASGTHDPPSSLAYKNQRPQPE